MIGVLWVRETDGNFDRHLINGDPLSARTVTVPVGRPAVWPLHRGETVGFSAVDALNYEQFTNIDISNLGEVLSNWTVERLWLQSAWAAEPLSLEWNRPLRARGKYVSDRVFSGQTVASTPGVAALLRRLHDTKVIDLRAGVSGGDR